MPGGPGGVPSSRWGMGGLGVSSRANAGPGAGRATQTATVTAAKPRTVTAKGIPGYASGGRSGTHVEPKAFQGRSYRPTASPVSAVPPSQRANFNRPFSATPRGGKGTGLIFPLAAVGIAGAAGWIGSDLADVADVNPGSLTDISNDLKDTAGSIFWTVVAIGGIAAIGVGGLAWLRS